MINDNKVIFHINNLINQIQLISNNDIKFVDFDFNFPITNKINFSDSILYFISFQNKNILVAYFIVDKSVNLLKLNILDYPELFIELNMEELDFNFNFNFDFDFDIDTKTFQYNLFEKINNFNKKIIHQGEIIVYNNISIKKNFSSNQIYPSLNKIYLKNNFYKKYCVILIKDGYFMITFNDETENYIKIENLQSLLEHQQLKIFKKIFTL